MPAPEYAGNTMPASRTTLIDMVADTGTASFDDVHDFGDQWYNMVRIVKLATAAPSAGRQRSFEATGSSASGCLQNCAVAPLSTQQRQLLGSLVGVGLPTTCAIGES